MTYIETLSAIIILSLFFAGFSQVFLPAYSSWDNAVQELSEAKSIEFAAQSFRNECAKPDRNIDIWKKAVLPASGLGDLQVTEIAKDGKVIALRAVFTVSGERIEVIGLCAQ